jgi:hypothetical protein
MQVWRHQGGSPTPRLTLQRASNLSRGHQNTQNTLKRKKRTDTQYDNKARLDRQRTGKLKVVTWNIRRIAEKKEELQTELLKDDRGRDGGTNFILRIQGTGIKPNPS